MTTHIIQFANDQLRISGDALDAIRRALTVEIYEPATVGGTVHIRRRERAFYQQERDHLIVPTPLLPRVIATLTRHGIEPRRVGMPPWRHMAASDQEWAHRVGLPLEQRLVAGALLDAPFGQLTYHTGASRDQMLATFIRRFPSLSIAVVSPGRRELHGLARRLTRLSGVQVYSDYQAANLHTPRVLVTTRFHFGSFNNDDWQIVVFTDPYGVLSSGTEDSPGAMQTAQRLARHGVAFYCLRPAYLRLTEVEELELEAICGPKIYTGSTRRGRVASVSVQFVEGVCRPIDNAPAGDAPAVAIKRAHYWHHQARNKFIADTAMAVSENDSSARDRLGLTLPAGELSTAILVESHEHAEALKRLLRDWTVISALPDASQPQSHLRQVNQAIITEAAAKERELTSDVIIVATAQPPAWNQLQFPRVVNDDQERDEQLVIDFADDWCLNASKGTHNRLKAYINHDFEITQRPCITMHSHKKLTAPS